jgi:mannose-6-phosphate isomerase-like protein (cupin superfamily)
MIRRVVTAERNGKAVIASDGSMHTTHDYTHVPGFQTTLVWATTEAIPSIAQESQDQVDQVKSVLPDPHGSRLIIVQFPPDSVMQSPNFNPAAAGQEFAQHIPGLAEKFEPDGSGMHKTMTVDYDIVLSGELWLELDDGEVRHLKPGDIVVQNGTRHAWHNRGQVPAVMAAILLNAKP